ncbi:hypothetical protein [Neobacillus rhizophilus]|uniref:Uncharacterized protein n=1 Tax=Neobacillus rhizophilus TaxID=2833579 RepID=A0A942U561_9BACI|nr:hypothetical protein [Neobacillus rhizophilus]MBS4214911.1 hypothetical protein [Neobacillus rhizophilus]
MSEPVFGMKPSRKFANGTIHENGSGKFQILDRFLENNVIMLKYQWLDSGEIEVNKEVNINASIWKFQKSHGLIDSPTYTPHIDAFTPAENHELLEQILNLEQDSISTQQGLKEHLDLLERTILEQSKDISKLMELVTQNQHTLSELVKDRDLLNKLIDKI